MSTNKYSTSLLLLAVLALIGTYIGKAVGLGFFILGALFILLTWLVTSKSNMLRYAPIDTRKIIKNPVFLLATLTLLSFGWSSWNGISPDATFENWMQVFALAVCGALWFVGLQRIEENNLLKLPKYIFWGTVILATIFILETIVWKITDYSPHGEHFFLSMRKISSVCSILLPFAFLYALSKERIIYWLLICVCIIPVFLCGGRSGMVAFTLMLTMFAMIYPWASLQRIKQSFYAYFLAPIVAIVIGTLGYYWVAGEVRFSDRLSGSDALSGAGRTDIWAYTFERFLENPLFGIGIQGFRHLDFSDTQLNSKMHPHNMPLEVLIETGAVGFALLFATALSILLFTIWQTRKATLYPAGKLRLLVDTAFISLISYTICSLFLTSFFHGWWLVYPLMILVILAVSSLALMKREREMRTHYGATRTKSYDVAVSIIMPCHNGEAYIGQAIESVLNQTYNNWELLIVDDGSRDKSRTILETYKQKDTRIRTFQNETATGEGAARNWLIAQAKGRFIAFLDCDDVWHPQKLDVQIKAMEDNFLPLTYGYYDVVDEVGNVTGRVCTNRQKINITHMLSSNDISCPTAVFDSAYFGKPKMPNKKRNTDMLYWVSLLRIAHHATCIPQVLAQYRVHKSGVSYNKIKMATSHWATFRDDLSLPMPMAIFYFAYYCLRGLKKTFDSRGTLRLK